MSHIRILVSGIKKMLRELIIFLFLSIHCIVGQKGCVGVLTRGFDAIIEPPLCSSNNNNNNNNNNINNNNNNNSCNNTNNNNISVLWVLSYRNTKICYGNPKHYGSVNSNGSLVIHGSENYPLDSSSVTALVYDGNVLCNTSDFTIKLLPLYSFSGLHVEYPVQESNNFTIKFAGDPFVLCLSANTKGLSSNNRSTYWIRSRDKQKIYRESLSITNCTNCSCFINELKMRRGGKRTQSFLALYRTDPCYAVPNKLISVLYISTTQSMDNNSEFSFRYADIRGIGLPLASEGHFFRLSVRDYLMIDPLISVSPVNLTLSYEDTNGSVLCNGTTSVGEILEWKSADDNETVKWCVTNESCNCKGNESGTYQTLINKQIVSLSSSNSSSVLHTLVKLIICKSTANYAFKRYYCTVLNGSTHESVLVSYTDRPTEETPSSSSPPNQPTSTTVLYVLLTVSILLPLLTLFICIIIACIFCLKKRTKQEEMVQVLRGRVSLCSPTLYMKQQSILHADPLEFPREMLHFQNTIGEGQFGQVWKAQAVGIVPEDPSLNVVAVKTLKSDADFIDKEELLAELEIMKNLYPHPNILNLLGYCTVGGPCYIIMEFAMYGNLRDFLRSLKNVHSSSSSILAPFQSSSNHPMALNEGQTVDPWSLYNNIPIHYNTVLKQHLINTDYYNQHNNGIEDTQLINADTQMINADTQMVNADTQMVNADTQMIDVDTQMSNTDIEMTDADTHMINHPLLTEKDIFNFSLQISRGMEHLQSQKCIHRDLAARNVLIAEGQILKIADFGLAKELSSKDYYRRLSSGKLPARWMAVESLDDRQTHSHQSDIWSFGVVLWEICSYGDTPYKDHGIGNTLESLLLFIKNGNRLKRPENCSSDMYQLMLQCWNDDPKLRPNFNELVHKFDKLLSLAHGYLQMTSEN